MWIYEYKNWPNFTWDTEALAEKLSDVRYKQGRLLGKMENLGFYLQLEASLNTITQDIIKSSAIEGESLNMKEVRSSVARRLGIDIGLSIPASRNIEGILDIMFDAAQNFEKPLTKDRLFDWHSALFPTGRSGMYKIAAGHWRTSETEPMQVVSGAYGHERIHYVAPHANMIDDEIDVFLKWFDGKNAMNPVLKAGIAHLWFVTIHPFEDGNGRIARVIADMALARADKIKQRFYSMSKQIEAEKKNYYYELEHQQRGTTNITGWLDWFVGCLERAIDNSDEILSTVLYKSQLWRAMNEHPVNERQRKIINLMLEDDFKGHMNTSKYAKIAKCSNDTALRDIQELKEHGIFIQNPGGGRSTSYSLIKYS